MTLGNLIPGNALAAIAATIILAAAAQHPAAAQAPETKSIRVGGAAQQHNLVSQVRPVYPPEAKAARIQGTVQLQITVGKDGTVQNLNVISGPSELQQSAVEAVRHWVYKPTLLNGEPVEVVTTVDVNYTLSQ